MNYKLYEYDQWIDFIDKDALSIIAKKIWDERKFPVETDEKEESEENKTDKKHQPFLRFDGNKIRANNYVGFIQTEKDLVEIYPKVFKSNPNINKKDMLRHIFFWFSYCRKFKFPFNQVTLGTLNVDNFPELIINLIANQFLETISNQPLSMYQPMEEALQTPRGSINFKRYISNSLVRGNFQNIECDYEPYLFDNKVNRAIKFCSRLLMGQTKFPESMQTFQEVIFILDDVEDIPCTINEIETIHLNSFFDGYNWVLDSCKLILNQQLYATDPYDLSQWSLLFPMEYIFEDFVAGFLKQHFSNEWNIDYQKSGKYLALPINEHGNGVFQMLHDIFLTSKLNKERKIIIDTKYKLRPTDFKNDVKKGIAQSDMYQMTSYAFRSGCKEVILIYPNLSGNLNKKDTFKIQSSFNPLDIINITAIEIPFWTEKSFCAKEFESNLKNQFEKILNPILERN